MYAIKKNYEIVKKKFVLSLFFVLVLQIAFFASNWPMVSGSTDGVLVRGAVHKVAGAATQGGGVAVSVAVGGGCTVSTSSCALLKLIWILSSGPCAGVLAERLKHQAMQKMSMTRLQIAAP